MSKMSPSPAGCPICREAKVIAHFPSFHEMWKGVEVEVCEPCQKDCGIESVHMKASAVPPIIEQRMRHRNGVVEFA